jgi:hypothetical protein
MKNIFQFLFLSVVIFSIASCDDDDPIIENPEEIITTLNYTLTPMSGDPVTLSFQDLDGDGPNAPVVTVEALAANTTYTGSVELLNESESPAEDIGAEVKEEDLDHQLFFEAAGGLNATITYDDQDSEGNPLGIVTTLTTGDASTGTLTITLRHEPDKGAAGVADGQITNAGGETDIEVTFNVEIQ